MPAEIQEVIAPKTRLLWVLVFAGGAFMITRLMIAILFAVAAGLVILWNSLHPQFEKRHISNGRNARESQ